jgi:hypothetical protein
VVGGRVNISGSSGVCKAGSQLLALLGGSAVTSLPCANRKRLWAAHVDGCAEGGHMASSAGLALCGQVLVVRGGSRFLVSSTASR